MLDTDYIRPILSIFRYGLPFTRNMADNAFGGMAPFTVASHTLAVKCPFQPRFSEILRLGSDLAVAFPTGWDFPGRAVVMTLSASFSHSHHFSMKLMVESNRLIKIHELIQDCNLRPLGWRMGRASPSQIPHTLFQARLFSGRNHANVAIAAGWLVGIL
jgi:hypothetical protein